MNYVAIATLLTVAQHCGPFFHRAPVVHHTPHVVERIVEVVTPVAVPVVVPATVFQYLPALQAVAPTAVQVQQPQVPVAQTASPAQTQTLSINELDNLIRQRLEVAMRARAGATSDPPALQVANAPVSTPQGSPQPANSQQLVQTVANSLAQKCASCHSSDRPSGGVTLFTRSGDGLQFSPSVGKDAILRAASPQNGAPARMPPAARTDPQAGLNETDLTALRQWVAQQ